MKNLSVFLLFFVTTLSAVAQDCPRIFQRGDTLFTDPAPQYQWFNDNQPIPGATQKWYLPPAKGNYAVQISAAALQVNVNFGRVIGGRIVDERYEPLADATITAGQVSVKSDVQGRFLLTGLEEGLTSTIVTITKAGFWKNTQRASFFDTAMTPLTAMLEPFRITNRFAAVQGVTIFEKGFYLTLPPNSAILESGQIYQGMISLSLKRSFPNEEGFGLRMPGGDFSAIDADGQEKILISSGFMSVEMVGAMGEKLALATDKEAILEFYIPWEQNKTAPDSMPLWHFDETNAIWKPESIARKKGTRYVATVKHFSGWNCAVPVGRARCKGKISNCKKEPVPYITVNVGQRIATANLVGEYTTFVPSDTDFDVTASVDTLKIKPLVEGEEREVNNLAGAVIDAIGLIDSTQNLSVWGAGISEYSIDGGTTFHPKTKKLSLKGQYPTRGIARDSLKCESVFRIALLPKREDCQRLDSSALAQEPNFRRIVTALEAKRTVYILNLTSEWNNLVGDFFPCLHELRISENNTSSLTSLPESLGSLTNLRSLNINNNAYLTSLPKSIGQLINLQNLILSAVPLTSLPESIGQLTNLQSFNAYLNKLTSLPESIGQLTNLHWLSIQANPLSSLPESIGNLNNLRGCDVTGNLLTSLPQSIGQLQNLQELRLGANRLTNLPESIGNLKNLRKLNIIGNLLASLPESIGQLQNLQELQVGDNQLTSLPESFGQLTSLQNLYIYDNQLTSLPESFGQLTNLQDMYIYDNQLTSLPESFGQLTSLQRLTIYNNQLTTLPESIANLKETLRILNLVGNPISVEEQARIRSWLPKTAIAF